MHSTTGDDEVCESSLSLFLGPHNQAHQWHGFCNADALRHLLNKSDSNKAPRKKWKHEYVIAVPMVPVEMFVSKSLYIMSSYQVIW